MGPSTLLVHGHGVETPYGDIVPPVHISTVYEQSGVGRRSDRGFELKYSREENPTVRGLERLLARLEAGSDALAVNSGMAAVALVLHWLALARARIVVPMEAYGGTLALAEEYSRLGLEVVRAWPGTEEIVEAIAFHRPTAVLVETITNPMVRVIDVGEVARAALDEEALLVVDNTFATPLLVRPLEHGAGLVLHSLTKYIAGHNDVLGGAVVAAEQGLVEELWERRRLLGTIIQPLDAYLVLRGAKTLRARFEAASRTALAVAEFLEDHPRVAEVYYPGLPSSPYHSVARRLFRLPLYGAVLSFRVRGGAEEARRVLARLRIVRHAPSLGATETLATLPAESSAKTIDPETRRRLGITPDLIRLSVGLEDPEDILEDLDQALTGKTVPRRAGERVEALA